MQYVKNDKASTAAFASAGSVARQYIAACALVEARRTKATVFGSSFESSFEECRRVGSVNGLLAAAEGRYTRSQLQAQLFRGMAQWCWTEMGSRFLDLCVAVPSQRVLPEWAVKVREARSDNVDITALFKEKDVLRGIHTEVERFLSIIDSPLAHLMALLRIPMGARDGVPIATALEFRIAHLWLLSDFFHNLLPGVHEGVIPTSVTVGNDIIDLTTVKVALASEETQNAVLRDGGDVFANALAESFPTSSGAVNALAQSGAKSDPEKRGTYLLNALNGELVVAKFTALNLVTNTRGISMGSLALKDTPMRSYKLVVFSLAWIRIYNFNVALLFHMHAMDNRAVGRDNDDNEWIGIWLRMAGRFHSGLGVNTEEDLMSIGTYGDPQSIFAFHVKYKTLKDKVQDDY